MRSPERTLVRGAWTVIAASVLGPAAVFADAAVRGLPPWRGPSAFLAGYHWVQPLRAARQLQVGAESLAPFNHQAPYQLVGTRRANAHVEGRRLVTSRPGPGGARRRSPPCKRPLATPRYPSDAGRV